MLGTFTIIDRIQCEIDEAEEYIELANMFKASKPDKAKLFLELAKDECKHAEKLIAFKQASITRQTREMGMADTAADKAKEHANAAWEHMQPLLSAEVGDLRKEIMAVEQSLHNPY